jgi:hypothetical protein
MNQVALRGRRACLRQLERLPPGYVGEGLGVGPCIAIATALHRERSSSSTATVLGGQRATIGSSSFGESDAQALVSILKTKAEGWAVLADAQSAMAHSCIVSYFVKSAKFEYLFSGQRELTQRLQQLFEVRPALCTVLDHYAPTCLWQDTQWLIIILHSSLNCCNVPTT